MKLHEFIKNNFAGNISNFAKAYGITRQTVYNLLEGKTSPQTKLREALKRKGVRFEKKEAGMKVLNTKKGSVITCSENEFCKMFAAEISAAEERYNERNADGQRYIQRLAAGEASDDEQSPFYNNLKENFNQYGDTWTSPRGVEPIYIIQ